MSRALLRIFGAIAMCLVVQAGLADDLKAGDKAPDADRTSETASTPTAAAAAEKKDDVFKPPPGFQTKKRGELVLYCQRDTTIGTRFKTEKCYDEKQMREYMLALEQQKLDVDRIRGTCGGGTMCAPPDPTAAR
jgi:hypothetical protein